jgi:mono/diheme cytochrome c family protein
LAGPEVLAWPRFEGRIEAAEGLAKQFARITVFALINTMSHTTRIPFVLAVVVGSILLGNAAIAKPAAERASYKEVIVPILRGRCYRCHSDAADNPSGKKKIKGKLVLTSIESIKKGGDEDAAAVPGKVDESLMIERIKLPHDDDDHMPPGDKPQMEAHELKVLEWWISASLPSGKSLKDAGAPADVIAAAEKVPSDDEVKKALVKIFAEAGTKTEELAKARKALEGAMAEVSQSFPNALGFVSQQDSDLTFTAVSMRKDFKDEHLAKLAPVNGGLVDVNLGSTSLTDAGAAHLSKMPRLKKLWLNGTQVTDNGLDVVKGLSELEYLNLYGTQVSDAGLMKLTGLKKLKKLYLWQTKVTPAAVEEFKKSVPGCDVNLGISVQ